MNIPAINSDNKYKKYRSDTESWRQAIENIFKQHDIELNNSDISTGFNSTYPVFLIDSYVIKLFGYRHNAEQVFNNERSAHHYLVKDSYIKSPKIMAEGMVTAVVGNLWSYLILEKISGKSWLDSTLTKDKQIAVVTKLEWQIKHIHALPNITKIKSDNDWHDLDIKAAARKSVLPEHLIIQIPKFLQHINAFDRVITHGDLVGMQFFIDDTNLSGIIDWGDATFTDRHYELGKLTNMFQCDKLLLTTLLDAANWPVTKNFAKKTLGLALYRQAVGLTQHFSFDVFYQLPEILPLHEIKTLEELADLMFDIK
jgi:hygromycin-B 7''-O-kinase